MDARDPYEIVDAIRRQRIKDLKAGVVLVITLAVVPLLFIAAIFASVLS